MASKVPRRPPPAPPIKPRHFSRSSGTSAPSVPEPKERTSQLSTAVSDELKAKINASSTAESNGQTEGATVTEQNVESEHDTACTTHHSTSDTPAVARVNESELLCSNQTSYGGTDMFVPWPGSITSNPYHLSTSALRGVHSPSDVHRSISSAGSLSSNPEECFVEMLTLNDAQSSSSSSAQWRETARWIRYEEEFVADVGRWGHPHVPSLNYGSLRSLQKLFTSGDAILLDLSPGTCFNFHSVLLSISDQLASMGALSSQTSREFRDLLSSPCVHHEQLLKPHGALTGVSSFLKHRGSGKSRIQRQYVSKEQAQRAGSLGTSHAQEHRPLKSHGMLRRSSTDISLSRHGKHGQVSSQRDAEEGLAERHRDRGFISLVKEENQCSSQSSADSSPHGSADHLMSAQSAITHGYHELTAPQVELLQKLPMNAEAASVLIGEVDFLKEPLVFLARLSIPYVLGDLVEIPLPTRYIAVVLTPRNTGPVQHLHEIGRSLCTLLANFSFRTELEKVASGADVADLIDQFLDTTVVVQHGTYDDSLLLQGIKDVLPTQLPEKPMTKSDGKRPVSKKGFGLFSRGKQPQTERNGNDNPLAKSGRLFGGMVADLRRLGRRYLSDFHDGLNLQCVITTIVMYFGMIAPLIAFGSLLGEKTEQTLGLTETLISSSFGGVIFGLLAGQPLMFISVTGPMAVFEAAVYSFCADYDIDFLAFRFWAGVWLFLFLLLIVGTDSSHFIQRFTQFTEEAFAALVAFIFIFESVSTVFKEFQLHPLKKFYPCTPEQCVRSSPEIWQNLSYTANCSADITDLLLVKAAGNSSDLDMRSAIDFSQDQPNTALFYMILVFGTFSLAFLLRSLKASHYMTKYSRRFFGDMSIFFSILVMFLLSRYVFAAIHTHKIIVPVGLEPTRERSWLVDPGPATSVGLVFGAAVPGLLAAFLIFVETQVTCLLCCNTDYKLKKTGGFHWNLMVTALLSLICSALGLPWLCGQPVTSVIHTQSLLKMNTRVPPGEKPQIQGVHEQRITPLLINILVGISLTSPVAGILSHVPTGVVMGIFLYMGVCNMLSLEFLRRAVLLFVPAKHHPVNSPDYQFTRHVSTVRMHLFTVVQLCCFALLVACKMTKLGIAFPLIIGLMVPLRDFVLAKIWSPRELKALDSH